MQAKIQRIEVTPRVGDGLRDVRGDTIKSQLKNDHNLTIKDVRSIMGYQINHQLSTDQLHRLVDDLFTDPIIEIGTFNQSLLDNKEAFNQTPDAVITVGFKPGVTDNRATAAQDGFTTLFPNISKNVQISTTISYVFFGLGDIDLNWLSNQLHNSLIETVVIADNNDCMIQDWPELQFPELKNITYTPPKSINLNVNDSKLIEISEEGLLALNLEEMQAIQRNYQDLEVQEIRKELSLPIDAPTDVELECLAQTWSEHCKHKIFAAKINHKDLETGEETEINSLFKTHIMKPTFDMQEEVDWLLSIFHDNSGVIAWNKDWSLCMKAETHNSPSALDPFGGAMTGIVGVNRDILGTGLGARPIANTDVFCFGPPNYSQEVPTGLFHPYRVLRGVHSGVRTGGNESGIPTVNGAMVFDERYLGKPLVYCGTVGIMPRKLNDGRESHIKTPHVGDIIYMVGGRVGSDGIHGATFSSLELTEESPSSAVQIGDPITQKKMVDMLLEARDIGLIQVITDNGAGGLSSSVGEMAELTRGANIDLAKVPLKQAGLSPWEILVSESQERMTVGISPSDCEAFEELARLHEVEATNIGIFTNDESFTITYEKDVVAHLPLGFLHDGCPQLNLNSEWQPPFHKSFQISDINEIEMGEILCKLMSRPNIATKEWWVRSYDHEVIGQSVIKPFCGINHDAPGDAAVIAPLPNSTQGVVISNGIIPRYSDIDTYSMVASTIDEALRNAVCVGVDLDLIAGLDNFCWPDSVESDKTPDGRYKLAQLVRANRALDDVCRAYKLPCISGKDSMKNDATLDGEKISVPPTLLFSLIGNHKDVRKAVSSDFKNNGDLIYLVGETHQELGASEISFMFREDGIGGIGGAVPKVDTNRNLTLYRALTKSMEDELILSAHDCSDGGLSVALTECCIGSDSGCEIDINPIYSDSNALDEWGILFGESQGRILVSIDPNKKDEFEISMGKNKFHYLGKIKSGNDIIITKEKKLILSAKLSELRNSWKSTLDGGVER